MCRLLERGWGAGERLGVWLLWKRTRSASCIGGLQQTILEQYHGLEKDDEVVLDADGHIFVVFRSRKPTIAQIRAQGPGHLRNIAHALEDRWVSFSVMLIWRK